MEENSGHPIFAGRYRYEPADDEGDQSQFGFPQLVLDLKTERMGVLKRAEITSKRIVRGLKNEAAVLQMLQGSGAPHVYETGEAEHDSTKYFYTVIEHVEGLSLEKGRGSLTDSERVEILQQFFNLLASAHQQGIVHNNIDIKHLIWNPDKHQLTVLDWASARLGVDPGQKTEFADDLASSAAIIFALITRPGVPLPVRSFALPDQSGLIPEIPKLPIEFRNICFWAPRTAAVGKPYHTASELFDASKRWTDPTYGQEPAPTPSQSARRIELNKSIAISASILVVFLIFAFLAGRNMLRSARAVAMFASTQISQAMDPSPAGANARFLPTPAPTEIQIQTAEFTSNQVDNATPEINSSPRSYTEPLLIFDQNTSSNDCWRNETNLRTNLWTSEGFTRRKDGFWRFGVEKDRTAEQWIQSDFSRCFEAGQVYAMALNAWVVQLELERESPTNPSSLEPGKEFGFFIEDTKGRKREYTFWVDKDIALHLRLREDNQIIYDDIVSIVKEGNLKIDEIYPRLYANFQIQVFFEINNQGMDILYLQEGPIQLPVEPKDMSPSQMVRMESITRQTFEDISKIGLIGYGGETQTVIWPLVIFGE